MTSVAAAQDASLKILCLYTCHRRHTAACITDSARPRAALPLDSRDTTFDVPAWHPPATSYQGRPNFLQFGPFFEEISLLDP